MPGLPDPVQFCRNHWQLFVKDLEERGAQRAAAVAVMWRSLDKSNLIAAALVIALGVYVASEASAWQYLSKDGPGPGFFPLWTGIGMIVLAAALVAGQVMHVLAGAAVEKTRWAGTGRVLLGWFGLMVSIALLEPAGFTVSFLLLTIFLVVGVFRRTLMAALAVGFGASIGFWILFVKLLKVQLPAGPWGF